MNTIFSASAKKCYAHLYFDIPATATEAQFKTDQP